MSTLKENNNEDIKKFIIVSGFSCTFKSTYISDLKGIKFYSPVKALSYIDAEIFNNNATFNSLHYLYAQYYAILNNPDCYDNNIVVERCIWDYMYFYFLIGYYSWIWNIDDIKYRKYLDILMEKFPGHVFEIHMLINESVRLKNIAVNTNIASRKFIYNTIEKYDNCQKAYLDFCRKIIDKLNIKYTEFIVTDEYVSKVLD